MKKQLFAKAEGRYSKEDLAWLHCHAAELETFFKEKFAHTRNRFNVQVKNLNGVKKVLTVSVDNTVRENSMGAYKLFISLPVMKKLGLPSLQK